MNRFSLSLSLLSVAAALLAACSPPPAGGAETVTAGPLPGSGGAVTPGEGMPLPAVSAAVQELAGARGLTTASITVVSAERVEWPNACLGTARPEQTCAAVVTPGYRVTLQAGAEQVVYHTDEFGATLVLAP